MTKKGMLIDLLKKADTTNNGNYDLRNHEFACHMQGEGPARPLKIEGGEYNNIDFSNSKFIQTHFIHVKFKNCVFDKVLFYDSVPISCEFKNCTFTSARFEDANMGIKTIYLSCKFDNISIVGHNFTFGHKTCYYKSRFIKIASEKYAEIGDVHFIDCIASGVLTRCRILSKKELRVIYGGNAPLKWLSLKYWRLKTLFIKSCNFEDLIIHHLEGKQNIKCYTTKYKNQDPE